MPIATLLPRHDEQDAACRTEDCMLIQPGVIYDFATIFIHTIFKKINILIVPGKVRDETIITNIRNRIPHPNEKTNMTELFLSIDSYIDILKIS